MWYNILRTLLDRRFHMKKTIIAIMLAAVTLMCTACSRSIDMEKLIGTWSCTPDGGEHITITITDESFPQSSGGVPGEPLKYERNSDGINVRGTDGKVLITLYYSEDGTVYYTVKASDGTDVKYTFTRS